MDKSRYGRRDRLVQEKRHDTYKEKGKWPESTVCSQCKAVFQEGRWSWGEVPEKANNTLCPACQRIKDNYPAGELEIRGKFYIHNKEELLNLIKNEEKREAGTHPMERIMNIQESDGLTTITTTGIHLARRIGEALSKAYQGTLEFTYGDGEKSIRVYWER